MSDQQKACRSATIVWQGFWQEQPSQIDMAFDMGELLINLQLFNPLQNNCDQFLCETLCPSQNPWQMSVS